jgi:hypothetical protein
LLKIGWVGIHWGGSVKDSAGVRNDVDIAHRMGDIIMSAAALRSSTSTDFPPRRNQRTGPPAAFVITIVLTGADIFAYSSVDGRVCLGIS